MAWINEAALRAQSATQRRSWCDDVCTSTADCHSSWTEEKSPYGEPLAAEHKLRRQTGERLKGRSASYRPQDARPPFP